MTAPDFSYDENLKIGYPSGGERIGPAWQAIWDKLADGRARRGGELAFDPEIPGGLAPGTIKNLLRQAAQCGHLEVELWASPLKTPGMSPGVKHAYYRRKL